MINYDTVKVNGVASAKRCQIPHNCKENLYLNNMENTGEGCSNNISFQEFNVKERSSNFTKEETRRLQTLVDKYKNILMCKKTDGSSAKQKDHAWACIDKEFNAIGQNPRTIKQLKYKFENMKRFAKKVASKERQEMIRTGGGKPPTIPPESDDATDWLKSIMSGSINGNEPIYDDDVITTSNSTPKTDNKNIIIINAGDADEVTSVHKSAEMNIDPGESVQNTEQLFAFDCSTPHSSLKRPIASQLKRLVKKKMHDSSDNIIKRTLREKKLSVLDELNNIELQKIKESINQGKELHEQQIKHNEEKHNLEIKKLQLEINILQMKIDKENK